jgi:hypothetical protein
MLLMLMIPVSLPAQTTGVSPVLTDKFSFGLGYFFPDKTIRIRVDGTVPEP